MTCAVSIGLSVICGMVEFVMPQSKSSVIHGHCQLTCKNNSNLTDSWQYFLKFYPILVSFIPPLLSVAMLCHHVSTFVHLDHHLI